MHAGPAGSAAPSHGATSPYVPPPGAVDLPAVLAVEPHTLPPDAPARRRLGPVFWTCAAWVALMVALAAAAPLLHLPKPNFQNYSAINSGPSLHHLLGTDELGRDLLSRIVWGSRVSLVIGFGAIAIGMTLGGTAGMVAGYLGRWVDSTLNAGSFVILAFPPLLAIMVVEAFWRPVATWKLIVMFGVAATPQLFRVVRATTLSFATREFVLAARALGASPARVIRRELLPNVAPAAVSFALIGVAIAIVLEGSLAFLGLSVSLPTASLGNVINEAAQQTNLQANPLAAVWPSLYIFLLLVALNLMADRLQARFEVREVKL